MIPLPIVLSDGFKPLVQIGDIVEVGQTIAQKIQKAEEIINIPQQFSIPVAKAKSLLKKNPGDFVKVGDVIAVKKSFLGMDTTAIISKVAGIVTRYERDSGNLVIRTSYQSLTENLVSPVAGVVGLCDNKQIVVNTDKHVVIGKNAVGATGEGEVFILEASFPKENISEDSNIMYLLDSRAIGKIVVGGSLARDVLMKAIGLGAVGLIGSKIANEDLDYIAGRKLTIPIIEMGEDTMTDLVRWNGKKVFMDAQTKSIIFLQI